MTESKPSYLQSCEDEFKNRFTDTDEDYIKLNNLKVKKNPPVIEGPCEVRNQRFNKDRSYHERNNKNWQRRGGNDGDRHRDRSNARDNRYYSGA